MITVKFLGGAKKSFSTPSLSVEKDELTVQQLLDYLILKKPEKTPELDTANILVAINGADSSVMGGKSAILHSGDIVSIIPVIHGGSPRVQFKIGSYNVEVFSLSANKNMDTEYLDNLRKQFPKLTLQAISKNFILNKSHIQKILFISIHAKKQNIMLSKKIETDILMRFAGTNQISQAIKQIGLNKKNSFFVIAFGHKSSLDKLHLSLKPQFDSKFFSKNNEKFLIKEFKITKKQIQSIDTKTPLEDILTERAAVLF